MARNNDTARIFVSYARSDGADFARQVRNRLEQEEGFTVWQDLAAMEGGRDWWRQIEVTLKHTDVEYLVLVMTPNALASDYVRKEWRLARQEAVCVIPILGPLPLDFSAMPGWMRNTHFVDESSDEQWRRMVRTLEATCKVPRVPMMAEAPPPDFVPRHRELEELRRMLLDPQRGDPVSITAALKGAGGYGKTTLAQALCHNEDVQEVFHDGVLWVTLGEQPEGLTAKVEDFIAMLEKGRPGFSDWQSASAHLDQLLTDRSILIVIDDVWNAADADPFLRGGERCAHLITTRDTATLPPNALQLPLDQMQPSEAVELLGFGIEGTDAKTLTQLASRLGEWPLLLKLVNAQLRNRLHLGQSAGAALDFVNRDLNKHGLVAFDDKNSKERNQAVVSTLGVSLDALDEDERERFTELAVFPEDIEVPLETVARLWGATACLDDLDTEKLIVRLFGLSLLQSLDLTIRRLRIHDVVRSFLRQQLGEIPLRGLNGRFLDAWELDLWSTLARDEPYLWYNLVWHLREAGRLEQQRALSLDYRWLRSKLSATDITALLADFACAPDDPTVRAVEGALRLSAHVLAKRKSELPSQLTGRLLDHPVPSIRAFCQRLREQETEPWLRPLRSTLTPSGGPLLRTMVGHNNLVTAVELSGDARQAVATTDDGTLQVWNLANGECLHTLKAHTKPISGLAVSGDCRRAVSCSWDETLRVWDLESEKCLHNLEGHGDEVAAVGVSGDGRRAVSSGRWDESLRVWDLDSGECLQTLETHIKSYGKLPVSGDGRLAVLYSSYGSTVVVWDLERGECLHTLEGHTDDVTAVAMSGDGRRAVSGSKDKTMRVWDLESGKCLHTLEGQRFEVKTVAVSGDGRRAVSSSRWDETLRVWDLESGECLHTSKRTRSDDFEALALSGDGQLAVSSSPDGTLWVWDPKVEVNPQNQQGHGNRVTAVALSSYGRRAVSGSKDKTLRVWDLESGKCLHTLEGHRDEVKIVAVSSDGRWAVSSGSWDDKTLRVWDLDTGDCLHTLEGHKKRINAVALVRDDQWAVSASDDHTLRMWDLENGKCLSTLEGHDDSVSAVAVSGDGRRAVLYGSYGSTMGVWDMERGECLQTLEGHPLGVTSIALSSDGRRAVSGSEDKTLRVWDLESGKCLNTLEGHTMPVWSVAMSVDGRWAVSLAKNYGTRAPHEKWRGDKPRVWNLDTGDCLHTLEAYTDDVNTIVLSSDGRRAVLGSEDKTIRVWDLKSGKCLLGFTGEAGVWAVATTADDSTIVAGDASGRVHVLRVQGLDQTPSGKSGTCHRILRRFRRLTSGIRAGYRVVCPKIRWETASAVRRLIAITYTATGDRKATRTAS